MKNFVCDFRCLKAVYFSYDYGKTWKEHRTSGFSKLTRIVGFYKDEFLALEGIYFREILLKVAVVLW
ncbi:MAG: hypothetical protein Q4B43_06055 [Bacteroidota bacterium]|nr:hypothetical protein [Bacteroidota bacterium]